MVKVCAQKEGVLAVSLHTNPPLSIVCSILLQLVKKSILLKHWHIIQLYHVFKEKPTVIHNCTTNLKHYLVHSQLIPPTHKPPSTMNKLPTVCQLCRSCSICNNITVLQLTKYWCCQFINDLYVPTHFCWSTEKINIWNYELDCEIVIWTVCCAKHDIWRRQFKLWETVMSIL